ncbi:MAG: hypothetical protein JOY93_10700 [Acidobacteriales bacterium]|nr:hypothetical protein [Terriglobales bacterium]
MLWWFLILGFSGGAVVWVGVAAYLRVRKHIGASEETIEQSLTQQALMRQSLMEQASLGQSVTEQALTGESVIGQSATEQAVTGMVADRESRVSPKP